MWTIIGEIPPFLFLLPALWCRGKNRLNADEERSQRTQASSLQITSPVLLCVRLSFLPKTRRGQGFSAVRDLMRLRSNSEG